eukprot:3940315-Rhodomonas_salina.3
MVLRSPYAVSGTDVGYAATRRQYRDPRQRVGDVVCYLPTPLLCNVLVLSWQMLLRDARTLPAGFFVQVPTDLPTRRQHKTVVLQGAGSMWAADSHAVREAFVLRLRRCTGSVVLR